VIYVLFGVLILGAVLTGIVIWGMINDEKNEHTIYDE
jgi:hypothetical protein